MYKSPKLSAESLSIVAACSLSWLLIIINLPALSVPVSSTSPSWSVVHPIKNSPNTKTDKTLKKNSIIVHDNNYIQNSGVDYGKDTEFEVISILEGTVISVKEDDSLKGTVEIKHENGFISVYQSLKDIKVKKDQVINQWQILGKSLCWTHPIQVCFP